MHLIISEPAVTSNPSTPPNDFSSVPNGGELRHALFEY